MFHRAISIAEKNLAQNDAQTQRLKSKYARLFLDTGRLEEAYNLAAAALNAQAIVNGLKHPWTKDSAHVTADALDALGRAAEAAGLREKYGIVPADKN